MVKKKTGILKALLILLLTICLPAIVNAKDYGTGSIGLNVDFKNEDTEKFTVNSVTVNGYDWESEEDTYLVDDGIAVIEISVTTLMQDAIPYISHCGEDCGEHYKVDADISETTSTFTVTYEKGDYDQTFIALSLIDDPRFGEGGDPGVCEIFYNTTGGSEIEPASFDCGTIPPRPEQIPTNGDFGFMNWYEDEEYTRPYLFDHEEHENVTVYAKWATEEDEEPHYKVVLDFNGAKDSDGNEFIETDAVAFVPMIVSELFIDEVGVIVPEGNKLVAIEINGKRYEIDKDEGYELNQDTTFVYIWEKPILGEKTIELKTESGFEVTFEGKEETEYNLTVVDFLTLTPEVLEELEVSEEEYKEIKDLFENSVEGYGDLLNVFVIEVDYRGQQYTDEVNFKIKMTDDMKKYNKFRFIYLDENNEFKVGEIVDAKVEGDYLVGTLPHLSVYAVTGEYVEEQSNNPKTNDNIIFNIIMLLLCISGLASGLVYFKKKYNN